MTTYLLYAVLALQVLDVASTLYAFRKNAHAYERNPVMRKLMDTFGTEVALIAPKLIFAALVWTYRDLFQDWGLWLVCVGYVVVVVNNIKVARK